MDDQQARLDEILDRLRAEYGPRERVRRLDPLDELVATILSQNTSDVNSGRAFRDLRRRFPTWEAVAAAEPGEVEDAIRSGGLARQKAPRIQAILRDLAASEHGLDLEWLAGLPPEDALGWLVAHRGVGVKSASCVLLFSFGMPVMPVDTHVYRVSTRLGLLPPGTSVERAHRVLTDTTPPGRVLEGHLLLIVHGRRTCTARRPRCGDCPLLDVCPEGRRRLGVAGAGHGYDRDGATERRRHG